MNTNGGVGVQLHHFWPRHYLKSGQLHVPKALRPGERAPGTHWIGGWVGPTVWTMTMMFSAKFTKIINYRERCERIY
jgi:hypothetical protein